MEVIVLKIILIKIFYYNILISNSKYYFLYSLVNLNSNFENCLFGCPFDKEKNTIDEK